MSSLPHGSAPLSCPVPIRRDLAYYCLCPCLQKGRAKWKLRKRGMRGGAARKGYAPHPYSAPPHSPRTHANGTRVHGTDPPPPAHSSGNTRCSHSLQLCAHFLPLCAHPGTPLSTPPLTPPHCVTSRVAFTTILLAQGHISYLLSKLELFCIY